MSVTPSSLPQRDLNHSSSPTQAVESMFEATHKRDRGEETGSPLRPGVLKEDVRDADLERASGAGRVVLSGDESGVRIADVYQKFPISLVFPKVDGRRCKEVVI